jgi:hypothetical protein
VGAQQWRVTLGRLATLDPDRARKAAREVLAKAGVAGVYNRATYASEKRMALQAWADHLDEILGTGECKVIPMVAPRA